MTHDSPHRSSVPAVMRTHVSQTEMTASSHMLQLDKMKERVRSALLVSLVFHVGVFAAGWVGELQRGEALNPRLLLPAATLLVLALANWQCAKRPVGTTYLIVAWFLAVALFMPDADPARLSRSSQLMSIGLLMFGWISARRIRKIDRRHP